MGALFLLGALSWPSWAGEAIEVLVEGLEGEALRNAEAALALPSGMVRDGVVNQTLRVIFERRIPERVRRALEPLGFFSPQTNTSAEKTPEGGEILRVAVVPGEPVRVSGVKIGILGPGDKEKDLKELAAGFPLKAGDVLHQGKYERGRDGFRQKALDLGYLKAKFAVQRVGVHRGERRAEIELLLETGPQFRYGEVFFEGASLYPRSFLERFLDFKTGDLYAYARTYQTQLNLINSDRFAAVSVETDIIEEARDHLVPVKITLDPSPPKRLRPGIGYASDTGVRFSLRYQDLNAFRRGHDFNADLSLAERRRALSALYAVPSPGHIENRTLLKAGLLQELLKPYETLLFTLEAERAQSFGRGRVGSAYLQFRQENFSEAGQEGKSSLILPGLRFTQRRVDDILRPRKGFRYSLEARGATENMGAESNFGQVLANGDLLLPLGRGFTLIPRIQLGGTWQKNPVTDLPPSLRFYAGGDRSVRGYTYQSLGPKDSAGNVVGGKNLLVGSLELEYALANNWAVAAFYDVGNAFNNTNELRLAQGAGIGIRYYTLAGPIRIDIARQINVDDPGFQLHISLGFAL
jgi:translocation and assembly module TamA